MEAGGLEHRNANQITVNSAAEISMSGTPVSASEITIAYPYRSWC